MGESEPKEIGEHNPVGGLAFFTSLIFLLFLGLLNTRTVLGMIELSVIPRWIVFGATSLVGFLLTRILFSERFFVFIHELKHSIVSNLAGNRAKKFKVADASGSFTYEYTKRTAAYNAFIALAPYWFPLFTLIATPLAALGLHEIPLAMIAVVGAAWGVDSACNVRDVSPVQSDLTGIRGGYLVGVLYVVAMNLTLLSILAAWVSKDLPGLYQLVLSLWEFLHRIAEPLFL